MGLEMRTACERCGAALAEDGEARICSYECTFCPACAEATSAVCPNCGGELLPPPAPDTPRGVTPGTGLPGPGGQSGADVE